jgi:site-specific DNA recombinase
LYRDPPAAVDSVLDGGVLKIVDEDTFYATQLRKEERAHIPATKQRESKCLLSGLLRCGNFGSGISVKDRDKTRKM